MGQTHQSERLLLMASSVSNKKKKKGNPDLISNL